jgi:hypothetical protein
MPSPYHFSRIAKKGRDEGITLGDVQDARNWYRDQAKNVRGVNANRLMAETPSRHFSRITEADIGNMICFWYDPKGKETLPYWDQFPLVFPIGMYNNGFLGINLHYLPRIYRARLMDALYDVSIKNEHNRIIKLQLSYGLLSSASKFAPFRPCIKRYLRSHVQSSFMYILPREWDMALMLPTERFVGKSASQVWKDSMRKF